MQQFLIFLSNISTKLINQFLIEQIYKLSTKINYVSYLICFISTNILLYVSILYSYIKII